MIVEAYIKHYRDNGKWSLDLDVAGGGVECCLARDCLDLADAVECINVVTKGLDFNFLDINVSVAGKNGIKRSIVSRDAMLDVKNICSYIEGKYVEAHECNGAMI